MYATYERMGENACLLKLDSRLDPVVNARVHAFARALREARIEGMVDIVPAYASVLLRHDLIGRAAIARWYRQVRAVVNATGSMPNDAATRVHQIAVCYDGTDLAYVAQHAGLSINEVIRRHAAAEYRVAMIGFSPGFPYLMGMDSRLATPRRATPRTVVPAGAVAIGGTQTGIYPRPSPGGWQLIGHTNTCLFDIHASTRPCLLEPGDRVRFVCVDGMSSGAMEAY